MATRTPQELAQDALLKASKAPSAVKAMEAITTAIVALAGEVNKLSNAISSGGATLNVDALHVHGIDI